jgi:integrase
LLIWRRSGVASPARFERTAPRLGMLGLIFRYLPQIHAHRDKCQISGGPAHFKLRSVPQDTACLRDICPVNVLSDGTAAVRTMKVISQDPTKITKATIDAAWRRRKSDQRLIVRDKDCRGLALIVNPTSVTWSYAYRPRGTDPLSGRRFPNRTVTLGNPTTHSPDDARTEANRIKGQAAAGADPASEKKARAEAERRNRGTTLGRLADEYATSLPRRPKMRGAGLPSEVYVGNEIAQVRLALVGMKATDKAAADLGTPEIRKALEQGDEGANAHARFGALSRFLDWCHDAGHIPVNPCTLISRARRPKAPRSRSNYLTVEELARLWKAVDRVKEPVWSDLVRFLIAIPCRRGEAVRLEWSHLDLMAGEWRQPDQMTKNGDPHRLRLHPLAVEVLEGRRRARAEADAAGDPAKVAHILASGAPRSGLVFPAPRSGGKIKTFSKIKVALVTATKSDDGGAELNGWTWHDFRRSFASALGEASIPEAVADAVLNHRQAATRGGVLGVYQRSSRWPEQARAMELWGRMLKASLDGGATDDNVVPMAGRAGQG